MWWIICLLLYCCIIPARSLSTENKDFLVVCIALAQCIKLFAAHFSPGSEITAVLPRSTVFSRDFLIAKPFNSLSLSPFLSTNNNMCFCSTIRFVRICVALSTLCVCGHDICS